MKTITSIQNSLVKQLVSLKEKSRNRKKEGIFIIEGEREIGLALQGEYDIEKLFFCPEIFDEVKQQHLLKGFQTPPECITISKEVYEKLTYRSSTEGVLALAKVKSHTLNELRLTHKKPLLLVAEAPEKPGNIGALLRTADAAGLDAVLIANPKTDLYNPNIIRSSVGCVFTNQIGVGTTDEILSFLKVKEIAVYCAALSASKPYNEVSFTEASAIVVGTEDEGLTEKWIAQSKQNIIIPMSGKIDSMNVSVAAAILVFEAKRQRISQ